MHGPPVEASGLVFDPRDHQRVLVCVSGLGVLSTTNGARTWTYVAQPGQQRSTCEVAFDPHNARTIYRLDRRGFLYRSTDSGQHWSRRSSLGNQSNGVGNSLMTSLTPVGQAVYVVVGSGLQESLDGGAHFRCVLATPGHGGTLVAAIRGSGGWIGTAAAAPDAGLQGMYLARDGGSWRLGAATDRIGSQSALDLQGMYGSLMDRMWEDHATHVVFTTGTVGGLYRWESSL